MSIGAIIPIFAGSLLVLPILKCLQGMVLSLKTGVLEGALGSSIKGVFSGNGLLYLHQLIVLILLDHVHNGIFLPKDRNYLVKITRLPISAHSCLILVVWNHL